VEVMDDESGESTQEDDVIGTGRSDSQTQTRDEADGEQEAGSRDKVTHTENFNA